MTHERRTADDVQRPAPGPFLVIGGLLSFVLCALAAATWVVASLPW